MKNELDAMLNSVKYAIQMEIDGKLFYLEASGGSSSPAGKDLFKWLAEQEDCHREKFEQIFKSIVEKKGWPVADIKQPGHTISRTAFAETIRKTGKLVNTFENDLVAADKAIEMEIKSRDYYSAQANKASSDAEKALYMAISAEEQGHYLALVDYKEYSQDPDGFFTRTEHHSIDGQ